MILFLADGRLGNQIFQYAFLKKIRKNKEMIIVSGFENLQEVFEVSDVLNINKKNRFIRILLYKFCKPVLSLLSNKKVITSVAVDYEKALDFYLREGTTYTVNKGFFNVFTFVNLGFFQSEKFFDKDIVKQLKIKDIYLHEADIFLKSVPKEATKVFIHIRRGDYKNYFIYGKSTLLQISYFNELIKWFIQNRNNPFFIFLSDEYEFVENEFKDIKNKLISSNKHYGVDLAIMTKCNSAILSPSSFGWWGSYLMSDRDVVFAPKYWQGFNSKCDLHSYPLAEYMTEVEVCVQS